MKILNPQLEADIENDVPLKLELGRGEDAREGFYGIDCLELEGLDVLADLNEPLSLLPDNCAESIYSRHTLEHVENFLPLMQEIWRIARPGARIEIIVPHFSNAFAHSDPTHVRVFGLLTMYYFVAKEDQPPGRRKVPAFYSDTRFQIDSIRIQFYRLNLFDRLFVPIFLRMVNYNFFCQRFYERRLSGLLRAWQITYVMRPKK